MKAKGCGMLSARSCYGHLGGELGNRLFQRLLELKWFEVEAGKSTVYKITTKGYEELEKLGVNMNGFIKESGINE